MRFLIVGAGATGVAIGTALGCDGNDVSFIDLPGQLEALAGKPFVFERAGRRAELPAPTIAVTANGLFDYVLLCVRLHELEATLAALHEHLAHDAAVVTLQPGTAAARRTAEVLGAGAVLPASLEATIELVEPGHARLLGDTLAVTVGEAAPTDSWRVEVLDAALSAAGIECRTLPAPAGDEEAPILTALQDALANDLQFANDLAKNPTATALDIAAGIRPDIVAAAAGPGNLPTALAAMAALPLPTRRAHSHIHATLPSIQVSTKDDSSTLPKGAA